MSSDKYNINFANQTATLNVKNVTADDCGHYTLLAENPQGITNQTGFEKKNFINCLNFDR